MRKSLIAFSAVLFSAVSLPQEIAADYTANFNGGRLPKGMTASNANSLGVVAECYAGGYTTDGWTVDRVGLKGYCAVSPTHTRTEEACENILSLPELDIEEGMWLRWDALSVSPDFPEAYHVNAVIEGEGVRELFSIDEESGEWVSRILPLSEFAGRKVKLEFVCCSVNKFMLALRSISVSTPSEPAFMVNDHTPRFAGVMDSDKVAVTVDATNIGADMDVIAIECIDGEGKVADRLEESGVWTTGANRVYEMEMAVESATSPAYRVEAVGAGGERVKLSEGQVYVSLYPRNVLLDEGTGMWCLNCAKGMLEMESMARSLGNQMIGVATHCQKDQDPLTNEEYWNQLGFYAAPYFKLNRIASSSSGSVSDMSHYYASPTECRVSISNISLQGNESADVTVTVDNGVELDNTSDRYRIGYVVTADFYRPGNRKFYQQNDATNPTSERFYFMPKRIPADLIVFHDVSLTSEAAFSGFEKSLPQEVMTAGGSHEFSWSFERPELLDFLKEGKVVAYIIDTQSGELLNAARKSLDEDSSVDALPSESLQSLETEYHTLQGLRVAKPEAGGMYIVRRGGKSRIEVVR